MQQYSIFDNTPKYKITKPIRLISLFSGYDSQLLSLKYLGADVTSWRTCEWAVKSIQALKDLHFAEDTKDYSKNLTKEQVVEFLYNKGISSNYNEPMSDNQIKRLGEAKQRQIYNNIQATHNMVNIQQVHVEDLGIVDINKYTYIMTYSFPCQDLSKAGKQKGMEKGSGTRSGMLWEVERILDECQMLPQILLMENVPDVCGSKNKHLFEAWKRKLQSLGYKNFAKILNAKDCGIPQNRERCFMLSILNTGMDYEFPQKQPLKLRLFNILEENVEEKYFLSDKAIQGALNTTFNCSKLENRLPKNGICPTLTARDYNGPKLVEVGLLEPKIIYEEPLNMPGWHHKACEVLSVNGISTCISTQSNNLLQKIKVPIKTNILESPNLKRQLCNKLVGSGKVREKTDYRIRKLTPRECFRLMGVKDEDFDKVAANQSNASLYHLAGDSIVVNVLMAIFKQML